MLEYSRLVDDPNGFCLLFISDKKGSTGALLNKSKCWDTLRRNENLKSERVGTIWYSYVPATENWININKKFREKF